MEEINEKQSKEEVKWIPYSKTVSVEEVTTEERGVPAAKIITKTVVSNYVSSVASDNAKILQSALNEISKNQA